MGEAAVSLDLREIQGLVTSAYPLSPAARYLLFEVEEAGAARRSLGELLEDQATFADDVDRHIRSRAAGGKRNLNVAFTSLGLTALGVSADRQADFSREFREGMVTPHRQRVLGDLDGSPSDPRRWLWGGPQNPLVHGALVLFARTEDMLDDFVGEVTRGLAGVRVLRTLETVLISHEHFGFQDGLGSPWVEGLHKPRGPHDRVAAGEILLGHPDQTGVPEPSPPFGRDGSYLVVRQLVQDVEGFWSSLRKEVGDDEAGRWASKMFGRWPDGTAMVRSPDKPTGDRSNDFEFRHDREGLRCPVGAHIRRANPRDVMVDKPEKSYGLVSRHRILRRGRSFGMPAGPDTWPEGVPPVEFISGAEDASGKRGMVFTCLNASLDRQFEFVQQTWLNNQKFGDLYDENDSITGAP